MVYASPPVVVFARMLERLTMGVNGESEARGSLSTLTVGESPPLQSRY